MHFLVFAVILIGTFNALLTCLFMFFQVKLFNEKRSDLEEQQLHLNVGLQKIRETVDQVSTRFSHLGRATARFVFVGGFFV